MTEGLYFAHFPHLPIHGTTHPGMTRVNCYCRLRWPSPGFSIAAIEAHGDYTRILLNEGKTLMMKQTLFYWQTQLPAGLFAKVSRSLLVNTQSVAKMVKKNLHTWELQLQGAKEPIQLSNLESKRLRAAL